MQFFKDNQCNQSIIQSIISFIKRNYITSSLTGQYLIFRLKPVSVHWYDARTTSANIRLHNM